MALSLERHDAPRAARLPAYVRRVAPARTHARGASRPWMVGLLGFAIAMFAETFAYMRDAPPVFALSKVWPILTLPFAAYALFHRRPPYAWVPLVLLAYAIGVTPVIAMYTFDIELVDALFPTVKMWALLHYLAAIGFLAVLHPSREELRRALLWLGGLTFGLLWGLWLLLPRSAYQWDPNLSNLFLIDLDRGARIFAPMTFGFYLMFYLNRSFWMRPALWKLLAVGIGLATLFIIYKEKLAIAVVALLLGFGAVATFRRQRRLFIGLGLIAGGIGAAAILLIDPDKLALALGGSLAVRKITGGLALHFLGEEPWRWLLGVGSMTKHGATGLDQFFRYEQFYLADIGWLGILFEYGVIGCGLMLSIYYAAARVTLRGLVPGDAMSAALFDSVLYVILSEVIYSAIMSPGIILTLAALALYKPRPA